MLVQAVSPACIVEPPRVLSPEAPAVLVDDDDDDEALQAILLASLQEAQAEEATVSHVSERAQAEQEARFNAAVKPPLVAKPGPLSEIWCASALPNLALDQSLHKMIILIATSSPYRAASAAPIATFRQTCANPSRISAGRRIA